MPMRAMRSSASVFIMEPFRSGCVQSALHRGRENSPDTVAPIITRRHAAAGYARAEAPDPQTYFWNFEIWW